MQVSGEVFFILIVASTCCAAFITPQGNSEPDNKVGTGILAWRRPIRFLPLLLFLLFAFQFSSVTAAVIQTAVICLCTSRA